LRAHVAPMAYPLGSMLVAEIALMALLNAVIDTIIVLVILSRRTERMMGVAKVRNERGETIYAPLDPDGDPIKVPVARVGKDGKMVVTEEYAGLAYALPTLAVTQLKASIMGKAGKLTQQANAAVLEGMDLNQAAQAMALQAFAKGQYGKALMSLIAPKIAEAIRSKSDGQAQGGDQGRVVLR
jgi:hypothetical protein